MGKKKKQNNAETTINNNNIISVSTANRDGKILNTIVYKGTVKVGYIDDKKLLTVVNTNHNKGMKPLFEFIANCMAGIGSNNYPRSIRLFSLGKKGGEVPSTLSYNNQSTLNPIAVNVDPYVWEENGNIFVTFKFLIPFTQLKTDNAINMFCLYGSENVDKGDPQGSEPSAVYVLTQEDDTLGSAISDTTAKSSSYNLFVEWTISVK